MLFGCLAGCAPRLKSSWFELSAPEISVEKRSPGFLKKNENDCCRDYHFAIPDEAHLDHFPKKYLRINIHVMDSTSGTQNFSRDSALAFIGEIIDLANQNLRKNVHNMLPRPNDNPTMPIGFEYVRPTAEDFYFHRDDQRYFFVSAGKNQNNYDWDILKKYNVSGDSAINMFFMPHHPDSQHVKTYVPGGQGIALGNNLKVAGIYEFRHERPRTFKGLINHEVGHILGLSHSWMEDGCEDTPVHKQNCWAWTPDPPCDRESYNNVMEYNAYQEAWTPCQIGRVLLGLSNLNSVPRRALRPDWCENDEKQTIFIRENIVWKSPKDLNGPIKILPGGSLTIRCRVSMPPGSKISVEPGGRLILDNCRIHQVCGKTWGGIQIQKLGEKTGIVETIGTPILENLEKDLRP